MSPSEIAALREEHRKRGDGILSYCEECGVDAQPWPCPVIRLCDALEEALRQRDTALDNCIEQVKRAEKAEAGRDDLRTQLDTGHDGCTVEIMQLAQELERLRTELDAVLRMMETTDELLSIIAPGTKHKP